MSSNDVNGDGLYILSRSFPCLCRKSSFGVQARSNMRSAPAFGFGTSLRETTSKQYISPSHARCMSGSNSPGAVYKTSSSIGSQLPSDKASSPAFGFGNSSRTERDHATAVPGPGSYKRQTSVGKQLDSTRTSSTRTVFGTATRDDIQKMYTDDDLAKTYYGLDSPPPNSYNIPSGIGKQVVSMRRSAPGWGCRTAERFKQEKAKMAMFEGSKSYRVSSACGDQVQSDKKSSPKFSFGETTREKLEKVLISMEHAKQSCGGCSPGPGVGRCLSAVGTQQLSYKRSAPGWGFGSAKQRSHGNAEDLPGPGAYCI